MTDIPTTRILSQRGVRPSVSRCMGYEFEDRAAEMLDADLVAPTHSRWSPRRETIVKGLAKRVGPIVHLDPGYRDTGSSSTVDLLIVHCQLPGDVLLLHALPKWRERTGRAVVVVEELWRSTLPGWGGHLQVLDEFDHVFVGVSSGADALREKLDAPVSYLPYGVDTVRFAPRDPSADRPIEVLNLGRRSAVTHTALLEWSLPEDRYYHFDSFTPNRCHDLAEHRVMYSRLHRHARFAISNRGVGAANVANEGEDALPARYMEAAAAGGVLVGVRPSAPEMDEHFGWIDSVIDAPFDAPDLPELLAALTATPERLDAIRVRNVTESMRRHDIANRVRTMLAAVDVAEPAAVADRIADRAREADRIEARSSDQA